MQLAGLWLMPGHTGGGPGSRSSCPDALLLLASRRPDQLCKTSIALLRPALCTLLLLPYALLPAPVAMASRLVCSSSASRMKVATALQGTTGAAALSMSA